MSESRYAVRLERDVVSARGPDATSYLQGQLSQDVTALGDGGSAWSWLLAPNGKVDALLRVTRLSASDWLLDTDAGWGPPVVARLDRFRLRTKVDFAPEEMGVIGLRGAGWEEAAASSGAVAVATPPWPGIIGADLIGPRTPPAGWPQMVPATYEAVRIKAGIPRMGAELDERTIPGETGLVSFTVSFTKGCYTGQELVARIDSRGGNVARRLRGLRPVGPVGAGTAPAADRFRPKSDLVTAEGTPAGVLTSAAHAPGGGSVGLGYVRRGVDPDAHLQVAGSDVWVQQVEPPF